MEQGIFTVGDEDIRLSMPIMKVDKQRRLVSGFATLDNEDQQQDTVLADASKKAFNSFYGNIREMHQPIAAGRLMKFEEKDFFDAKSNRNYNGVYVTARVSEGAEPTWKKVLDGTLTGFSIGGKIKKAKPADNGVGRIIEDYVIDELSLVDSPANQFAKFASIQKVDGQTILKGMISETTVSNVFYCKKDAAAYTSQEETSVCELCGDEAENIGWVEEGINKNKQIQNILFEKGIISTNEPSVTINNAVDFDALVNKFIQALTDKGGNSMAKSDDSTVENTETAEAVEEVETAGTEEEETQEVENVDFEKVLDAFVAKVDERLTAFREERDQELEKSTTSLADKLKEEVSQSFNSMEERLDAVDARLKTVEESGGIKKSLDDDDADLQKSNNKPKSIFAGVFTPTPNI